MADNDAPGEAPKANGKFAFGMSRTDSLELARHIVSAFGGPAEFAACAKEVYDDAPDGSHVRAQVFKTCVTLVEEATRVADRRNEDDLSQLSDEELEELVDRPIKLRILEEPLKWLPLFKRAVAALSDPVVAKQVMDELDELEFRTSS